MPELVPAAPLTPEWHAARRQGVTATDIVTILGLSSWDSVYSLFWRKLGQVPDEPDNDRMRLGRELEPYIAERWLIESGQGTLFPSALYRHSDRAWQMATCDRLNYEGQPIELKSWADADRRSWNAQAPLYTGRVGDDGEHLDPEPPMPATGGQPPARVRAQVLWQMDVMDVAVGHVGVVFLPSGEFRSYVIEHGLHDTLNPPHMTCPVCSDLKIMRAAGEEFMARLRLELPPPDPDSSAASLAAVRARFARQPDKQADVDADLWASFQANDQAVKAHEALKRAAEILLREQAGEASVLCVDGLPVARRVIVDAKVKAHTRHQDYLKRIEPKGDGSE